MKVVSPHQSLSYPSHANASQSPFPVPIPDKNVLVWTSQNMPLDVFEFHISLTPAPVPPLASIIYHQNITHHHPNSLFHLPTHTFFSS